jgi:hypothetical protein
MIKSAFQIFAPANFPVGEDTDRWQALQAGVLTRLRKFEMLLRQNDR